MVWVERRGMRADPGPPGPEPASGPFGLFQPLADALKFMFKEDVTPAAADKPLYLLAPVLALMPAFTTFVGDPLRARPRRSIGRHDPAGGGQRRRPACSSSWRSRASASTRWCMAGYASNNKFSLLGAIRASAQLISYELALTHRGARGADPGRLVPPDDVVAYQQAHVWNFIPQILGFLVFLIASFAETNRLPFDLPEAESELVAGFHTEYGAMRFAALLHGRVHRTWRRSRRSA